MSPSCIMFWIATRGRWAAWALSSGEAWGCVFSKSKWQNQEGRMSHKRWRAALPCLQGRNVSLDFIRSFRLEHSCVLPTAWVAPRISNGLRKVTGWKRWLLVQSKSDLPTAWIRWRACIADIPRQARPRWEVCETSHSSICTIGEREIDRLVLPLALVSLHMRARMRLPIVRQCPRPFGLCSC